MTLIKKVAKYIYTIRLKITGRKSLFLTIGIYVKNIWQSIEIIFISRIQF
jgi:hypothetical protein